MIFKKIFNDVLDYWELTNTEVLSIFSKRTKVLFQYLESDYLLDLSMEKVTNNNVELCYRNNSIAVVISFNTLDSMIFISSRKIINGKPANYTDDENIIHLHYLIIYYDQNIDIDKLQPYRWNFEAPLELSAMLLKKYGSDILSGEAWISRQNVLERINNR